MSAIRHYWLIVLIWPMTGLAADVIRTDFVSLIDPDIPAQNSIEEYDERCLPLWRQALKRPEVDLQRMAAETVARAVEAGVPGVETLLPDVQEVFHREQLDPVVRFAAARALITLNDRASAEALDRHARAGGQSLRQLVEPALAVWKYEPIQAVWKGRLVGNGLLRQDRLLAIRGLGTTGDPSALPRLLELVESSEASLEERLAAAEASGKIAATGLEALARKLAEQGGTFRQLCAVALLSHHESTEAIALLTGLAREPEPTVASKALARLRAFAPEVMLTLAEDAMRHKDPNVRREGIAAYLAWPTPDRVRFVGRLLDDRHPGLRGTIRDEFVVLAKQPELQDAVLQISREVLAEESWRGQEQATLVLATLDDKSSANRFVELLVSPRGEVAVTTAWGLRKLAVPDTRQAILDQAQAQTELRRKGLSNRTVDTHVAHLFEALGVMKYMPADKLLREYLPLTLSLGEFSRPCAAWALGKLYEGTTNPELAELLIARVIDPATMPPEFSEVRQMSAISLARIKATETVERFKKYVGPAYGPYRESLVFRWAMMQLTSEQIPLPPPGRVTRGVWFLEPAGAKAKSP